MNRLDTSGLVYMRSHSIIAFSGFSELQGIMKELPLAQPVYLMLSSCSFMKTTSLPVDLKFSYSLPGFQFSIIAKPLPASRLFSVLVVMSGMIRPSWFH